MRLAISHFIPTFLCMARKKDQPPAKSPAQDSLSERKPSRELWPFADGLSIPSQLVEQEKIAEIVALLWMPAELSEDERLARIVRAADLFESIKPCDGIEAMLAAQMVGAHSAAMECLRRSMLPNQTFEGRNATLGHAQRLMGLYTRQLAALDKHRGKGQQKVTVEYVNVESGGQAIVGHVETGTSDTGTPYEAPAVSGKKRCRMHGGAKGSGAPAGNQNALKHGLCTAEAISLRRDVNPLQRGGSKAIEEVLK